MSKDQDKLIEILRRSSSKLSENLQDAINSENWQLFERRLDRWKLNTASVIRNSLGESESAEFERSAFVSITMNDYEEYWTEVCESLNGYIQALIESIEDETFAVQSTSGAIREKSTVPNLPVERDKTKNSKDVFVVHGHDDMNLALLCEMLKERFNLKPIVLKEKPGMSRTIIEKFEEEAEPAAFALALLSPDDMVETKEGKYAQARPNVVFELGWFFARLGRGNVRIILKKGTQIHSDLDGIERIEFHESVEETLIKLERELVAGGYDKSKKAFVR